MRKISVVILAISFLIMASGCSEKITDKIEEKNGLAYAPNETEPFTGKYKISYPNEQELVIAYRNGQKEGETNYKNGKINGLATMWHENGQKKYEGNYKDSKRDGLTTVWYENGQKMSEGSYKNGKRDGLLTNWRENGEKIREENYKDGKLNGLDTKFSNGRKTKETNYKDGVEIN
jgi:antitoxin component YwqK of YwqJK toxin-antitoxin module